MFKKYKKIFMAGGAVIAACLFIVYLCVLFKPGIWHNDAFLYRNDDGTFAGSDIYADYKMEIAEADYGKDINFSLNDKKFYYQLKCGDGTKVQVIKDGETLFDGDAFRSGDAWILLDESEELIDVVINRYGSTPTEEELLPNRTMLYNWAMAEDLDTRGEPVMILLILIIAVILFLDIKFPQLFWFIEHGLSTTGGEPSAFYYFGQKIGRIVMTVAIIACVIMTFTLH